MRSLGKTNLKPVEEGQMSGAITRGVLFVHSAPSALCPHVEWAAGGVLGMRLSLDWTAQPGDGLSVTLPTLSRATPAIVLDLGTGPRARLDVTGEPDSRPPE